MTPEQIIEREIRAIKPNAKNVTVMFLEDDETWVAIVDDMEYRMEIGSDDDNFVFICGACDTIAFPFPEDWPV